MKNILLILLISVFSCDHPKQDLEVTSYGKSYVQYGGFGINVIGKDTLNVQRHLTWDGQEWVPDSTLSTIIKKNGIIEYGVPTRADWIDPNDHLVIVAKNGIFSFGRPDTLRFEFDIQYNPDTRSFKAVDREEPLRKFKRQASAFNPVWMEGGEEFELKSTPPSYGTTWIEVGAQQENIYKGKSIFSNGEVTVEDFERFYPELKNQ